MNRNKRIVAALLTLVLAVGGLPVAANARDVMPDNLSRLIPADLNPEELKPLVDLTGEPDNIQTPALPENEPAAATSGTCGDNLTWSVDGDALTISGTGDMYDYSPENPAPWNHLCDTICYITLENGVTSIGKLALANMPNLMRCGIADTVTYIGDSAFKGSSCGIVTGLVFLGDQPTFHQNALNQFSGWGHYFRAWDPYSLTQHGGSITWRRGTVILDDSSRFLYSLNEPINPEELRFKAYPSTYVEDLYDYTPGEIIIGEYDNSTCGEKSVRLKVDGEGMIYTYMVTEENDLTDTITVEYDQIYEYTGSLIYPQPVVRSGDQILGHPGHYTITHDNFKTLGDGNTFTITGKGIYSGYEKTFPYTIVKQDIASAVDSVYVGNAEFYGMPVAPEVKVYWNLKEGEDYLVIYEDNVNIGTGTAQIVGIGGYTGTITKNFQINKKDTTLYLDGAFSGNAAEGEYNDDYYYQEGILSPGLLTARIDVGYYHAAYYALYRIVGEDAELVTEYTPEPGTSRETMFTYDFTDVYNSDNPEGGETHMLVYQWMNDDYAIFSGVCVMFVPSKVPEATSMVMGKVLEDGDFRREYLTVAGEDGIVRDVTWTSSDESILTVDKGDVSILKPGTAAVTAQMGDLSLCYEIEVPTLKLSDGIIFNYEAEDGIANVIYVDQLLEAGTDYSVNAKTDDEITEVWAEGKGLFSGLVMRQFDAVTGDAIGHTHTFDFACDDTCGTCDFTRETGHQYGDTWTKDMDGHWHACSVCGEKADYAEHSLNADGECSVCGPLYTPGDLDGSLAVNEDDAIYLLQHVLLPDFFPVYQSVDYDHNGQINEDDAIYLLQHVLLPEFFPLG